MKKVTLLFGLLLAFTASVALAAPGVNLRWTSCAGDGGTLNKTFACNSNAGTNILVASFELGEDILQSSGQELVIDLASATTPLPAWWSFKNVGTCRLGALGINTTVSATAANCVDWASNGAATGGLGAYNIGERGPNTARIKIAIAVAAAGLVDLLTATEYFSCNVTVNNSKTVGTGACAGCNDGVCIVFNSIKCTTQEAIRDRTISGPANGTDSDYITWQGGGVPVVGGVTGCPAATPTRNATWGKVKSLYR